MVEFIIYIATSIDGYIARSDGSIDWLPSPEDNEEDFGYNKFYDSIDALIMGATTYKQVLGFGDWPYPGKISYVVTNRNLSTKPTDVLFIKGGVEEVLKNVKEKDYKRIWLMGGGSLISSFINRGLVNEYIITLIPTILGSGISLYQSVTELKLDLVDTKSYPSGIVELHYKKTWA